MCLVGCVVRTVVGGVIRAELGVVDALVGAQSDAGGQSAEVAAELEGRAGQDHGLLAEQPVPQRERHVERRDPQVVAAACGIALADPQDVVFGVGRHPLGDLAYFVGHRLGLLSDRVGLGPVVLRQRREAGAGTVSHHGQRVGELVGHRIDAPGRRRGDRVAQGVGCVLELVGLTLVEKVAGSLGGSLDNPW